MKKWLFVIPLLIVAITGPLLLQRLEDGKKKEGLITKYEVLIRDATKTFDQVQDTATLEQAMPEIFRICLDYDHWKQNMSDTVFTIQDAERLSTMERVEAVDKPFRSSRTRMLKLFDDNTDLQLELVEKLKQMPHSQARIDGTLELEREFQHLFDRESNDHD
ncbi:MAG: hypothetical protein AAF492_19750 [Verrucomicrobiota bacterium]